MNNIVRDYTDVVFENYNSFIKEHTEFFTSPSKSIEMIATEGSFNSFVNTLTDSMSKSSKSSVERVLNRERIALLQEAHGGQIASSGSAIGYAVSYFPILADIYSDPVISQIATVFPTNKPILTIPKITSIATSKNANGTSTSWKVPRSSNLVRASAIDITLTPGITNSLFSAPGIDPTVNVDTSRINKRYFLINQITVVDNNQAPAVNINVSVLLRPDSRGQIKGEFTFNDGTTPIPNPVTGNLLGNIDYEKGTVTFTSNYTISGISTLSANASVIFSPNSSDVGRTKIKLKQEGWDIDVDTREDFEVELFAEQIQDFRDIYNIELIRTLSMIIKTQMLLNKDQDLAYFLKSYEPQMAANGAASVCDLLAFTTNSTNPEFAPANIIDVFKGVIPFIASTTRRIHKNFRAAPQYILAGQQIASILESLQDYNINIPGTHYGEIGAKDSNVINFRKQIILSSDSIEDNKIYLVYKADTEDLSRTAIADIVYQPLMILEEMRNSVKHTYVKSRTAIEITAVDALGVITVEGADRYLISNV